MAVKIELKRSSVPGKVPTTASLDLGELAINTYDGTAYLKQEVNTTQSIVSLISSTYTGILPGTASIALSASYAATASYAPLYVLTSDFDNFTGSVVVTSSFNDFTGSVVLTSSFNSFTASYNTGSFSGSFTGDGSGLTNLSIGALDTSSLVTTSSFNSYTASINDWTSSVATTASFNSFTASYNTGSFSGSFVGTLEGTAATASYVENAQTASYVEIAQTASYAISAETASAILGGKATHVPFFNTDITLATSSIYQSGSDTIIINQNNATTANPEALYVWQPSQTSFNVISGKGNLNNYLQLNIQNTNQGTNASSDVVATAGNGDENGNYIDMGINSDNFSGFLGGPNDAYLYATGSHLHIGNATPDKPIQFFVGGPDTDVDRKMELNANGFHNITGSLEISGSLTVKQGITGSLLGSSSYATTASYALNVQAIDTSSLVTTSSFNAFTSSVVTTSSFNNFTSSVVSTSSFNNFTSSVVTTSSFNNFTGSVLTTSSFNSYTGSNTSQFAGTATYATTARTASYVAGANVGGTVLSASYAVDADHAQTSDYATIAGNGGVTSLIAGTGVSLIPSNGLGNVTVIATGVGGVTILSGSNVTASFLADTTWTFNHNLGTRTPIITVFDSNYNQIIPQNIELTNTSSATITFPTAESGFAIASLGGTTGTVLSSSYALQSTYSATASYYAETDPVFVAKSASLATTGSNTFRGNQTVTGSLFTSGSNTLIGNTVLTGSLSISGSTTQTGNNTLIGNTVLSGSFEVSGSTILHNSLFEVTGSTRIKGQTQISGSTSITGSFNVVNGDINIVSGSSFTRWGNKLFNYGQFSSLETQSGSANTAYAMKFDNTDFALNTRIVSSSRITVDNTGIYNLQFSAQLGNTANTAIDFDIWFMYTGSNLANSNTQVTLNKAPGSLGRLVAAWNVAMPIQANDYVEIMWSCDAATGQLQTQGTQVGPTRPAIPSVIATLTQIA